MTFCLPHSYPVPSTHAIAWGNWCRRTITATLTGGRLSNGHFSFLRADMCNIVCHTIKVIHFIREPLLSACDRTWQTLSPFYRNTSFHKIDSMVSRQHYFCVRMAFTLHIPGSSQSSLLFWIVALVVTPLGQDAPHSLHLWKFRKLSFRPSVVGCQRLGRYISEKTLLSELNYSWQLSTFGSNIHGSLLPIFGNTSTAPTHNINSTSLACSLPCLFKLGPTPVDPGFR
jgi:hypothetical protein